MSRVIRKPDFCENKGAAVADLEQVQGFHGESRVCVKLSEMNPILCSL